MCNLTNYKEKKMPSTLNKAYFSRPFSLKFILPMLSHTAAGSIMYKALWRLYILIQTMCRWNFAQRNLFIYYFYVVQYLFTCIMWMGFCFCLSLLFAPFLSIFSIIFYTIGRLFFINFSAQIPMFAHRCACLLSILLDSMSSKICL